ncbi:hypothetical protein EMIHUDRAFT_224272 [Emiliania huxleyi CCMP1516]|uniref:VPS10 domain-containing protein n=2 Tax=Emiliania huxleyi TaxID=2903 RepID=A0A0D3KSU1_EMIH1|nr:hypothetical protein EMIHUDRAFT_224272 [Emiliania huxleyi CCMP1516]EOD38826.1 hypothetical protein EMIHUDRAFT_224272 [Emiliania huxleyi CCMP1516]|eukprot:XP_005791255.1 hypothetical protein EMIHUDRAFT_224272 [Emiliania huxleyi CCMP1516]
MSPGYNQDSTVYLSEGGRFLRSEDGGAHWFDQFRLCDRGGGPRDFVAQRPGGRISIAQDSNFQLRRGRVGGPYELMNMPPSTKEECFALGADNEGFYVGSPSTGEMWRSRWSWGWEPLATVSEGFVTRISADFNGYLYVIGDQEDLVTRVGNSDGSLTAVKLPEAEAKVDDSKPTTPLSVAAHSPNGVETTTLYVLRRNVRSVLVTSDFGATWIVESIDNGDFESNLGDVQPAETFDLEEFTHVVADPTRQTAYLGAYAGVWKTDNMRDFSYLDTVRQSIYSIWAVADVQVTICTYAAGCWHGDLNVTELHDGSSMAFLEKIPSYTTSQTATRLQLRKNQESYNTVAQSPSGEFALRYVPRAQQGVRALQRVDGDLFTEDNYETLPDLPLIDPNRGFNSESLQKIEYASDTHIYGCGFNHGVLESIDGGFTWARIWEGNGGDVVDVKLSPSFQQDSTIVTLVRDINDEQRVRIYQSTDSGLSWSQISDVRFWPNVAFARDANGDPIVVALQTSGKGMDGELFAYDGSEFRRVGRQQVSQRKLKFGLDGLHVSPTGLLCASYVEGGLVCGELDAEYNFINKVHSIPTPFARDDANAELPPKFWRAGSSIQQLPIRGFNGKLAFSPNFANDHALFAASHYALYFSGDEGRTFRKVFELPWQAPLVDECCSPAATPPPPAPPAGSPRYVACGRTGRCDESDRWAAPSEKHEVRCCSDSRIDGWKKKDGCSVWSESDDDEMGGKCHHNKNFAQASTICEDAGARLCTRAELQGNCARRSGCGHDRDLIWAEYLGPASWPPEEFASAMDSARCLRCTRSSPCCWS